MFQLPVIFVNIIFYFCRTEFSSPSNSNKEHELTLRTDDKNEQCFDSAEIRMRKEFNPSANENPLQFNATLIPVEKNSNFDGKLGRLAKKVIVKRMSIPFEQVCENTCSIDLSVTANLAPSFQSPFVIGSSSFVTLIFTVINIGIDPAYLPVLKIPLGKNLLRYGRNTTPGLTFCDYNLGACHTRR